MTDTPDTDEKAVRIPVVASYAYELVHQIFPLQGLPLRVHTKALGASGNVVDSARYQVNAAYLTFHDTKVVAEVRSWEPKGLECPHKTLQALWIARRCSDIFQAEKLHREWKENYPSATCLLHDALSPFMRKHYPHSPHPVDAIELEFDSGDLVGCGPEIIVKL